MDLSPRTRLVTGCFIVCIFSASPHPGGASEKVFFHSEKLWPEDAIMTITGTLSKPSGQGSFPAVVLLPNCGGPETFEFAKFWPAYLNKLGYVTLNVDHFSPRNAKKCTKHFKPKNKEIAQDAYGALAYLAGLPFVDKNRVGVLGSSRGAAGINWFSGFGKATSEGLKFKGAVSLYGPHCTEVKLTEAMTPLLIILGDKERGVGSCRALPANERLSLYILPGVYHGFDQPSAIQRKNGGLKQDLFGNKRLYSKAATEKAQALVSEFFAIKLASISTSATVGKTDAPTLPKIGGKDPYAAVKRRDTDGDGKVSTAEWEKSPDLFSKIDADGDGFITAQEFYDRWKSLQ